MLDLFQAFFWSLTYVLLIVYANKFNTHGIPLISICLNFAWESVALFQSIVTKNFSVGFVIHTAWFLLDFLIVTLFLLFEQSNEKRNISKIIFSICYACAIVTFYILFKNGYMLLLCFTIDLIMAIDFLAFILKNKVKKHKLSYAIAIFKLLGDFCAWLYYKDSFLINPIGITVLICNILYLLILIKQGRYKNNPILNNTITVAIEEASK